MSTEQSTTSTTATPADAAKAADTTKDQTQTQGDPADLGDAGKKALAAERDARKAAEKATTDALAKVKAFEDAQKTEAEKAAEALTAAQQTAAESAAKALRYEVAAEKGIPLNAAMRLTGTTREELAADADVLKGLLGTTAPGPRADLSQASTRDPAAKGTPEADFANFLGAQLGTKP
jgi:hypothetical protein